MLTFALTIWGTIRGGSAGAVAPGGDYAPTYHIYGF